jgi:hypothetical protein
LRIVSTIPAGPELPDLDEGEAASIRLALAAPEQALLLIDERSGRAVAQELGLSIAGTAAVIGIARQRNLIPSARAVFAQLHGSDFRIAPAVIKAVLDRCGEGDSRQAGAILEGTPGGATPCPSRPPQRNPPGKRRPSE